jgi:hypothetical protein
MTDDIQHGYFGYLYYRVFRVYDEKSPLSYVNLCTLMHETRFDDSLPNDDNRARDGIQLRDEFISTLKSIVVEDYTELQSLGQCSIFEMLIALAYRADYLVENGVEWWFREFIDNLDLGKYNDRDYVPRSGIRINRVLNNFNNRRYSRNGKGGIFPLQRAKKDQRTLELWYQMHAYMTERQMY